MGGISVCPTFTPLQPRPWSARLHVVLHEACDVLADDIEFDIDDRSGTDVPEVRMPERVGDNGYLEGAVAGIYNRKADAVSSNRDTRNGHVCHALFLLVS